MINTKHLLKVSALWISTVWVVCFAGVALLPGIRPGFIRYGLHMWIDTGRDILTIGTFISGLIIWNIITFFAVGLFAKLFNSIKQ
jgi:hypothetical protein